MKFIFFIIAIFLQLTMADIVLIPLVREGANSSSAASLSKRGLYPTTTPTCSKDEVAAVIAFYPTIYSCNESAGTLQPWSVWASVKKDVCYANVLCTTTCEAFYNCGIQGLTLDEYNSCAGMYGICSPTSSYFKVTSNTETNFHAYTYDNNVCSGVPIDSIDSIYGQCSDGLGFCGYTSASWVSANKCPQNPDVSSASSIENYF